MAQWDNYSQKSAPADTDTLMLKDNAATGKPNKRLLFSGLWTWIVDKLTNAAINALQTTTKTVVGGMNNLQDAVTTLNSNTHVLATTLDDLCSKILALPSSRTVPLYIPATVTSDLINVNMTGKGYVSKVSNIIADIVIYSGANGELYSARLNPTTKEVSNVTSIPTRAEVNALNINTKYSLSGGTQLQANVDFDTLLPGNYYTYNTIAVQHGPFSDICGIVKVEHSAGTDDKYLRQTYRRYKDDIIYERIKDDNTWKDWIKLPARAEVDALNSNLTNTLKSGANNIENLIVGGYSTGSGNYFDLFVPLNTSGKTVTAASVSSSTIVFLPGQRVEFSSAPTITVLATTKYGVRLELSFPSTQSANVSGTVYLIGLTLTCS